MSDTPVTLFKHSYQALVLGASGAIGQAFVSALRNDSWCQHVEPISRSHNPAFDLEHPERFAEIALAAQAHGPYHCIIDATGALTIDGHGPEKSLAAMQSERLARAFQINAIGPALLLRHVAPLLAPGPAIYAKLSARVGSISDNHKGGWYGYRASKAALNMLLQTAAIELQRKNPELKVVALQPGTVASPLSQAFTASLPQLLTPEQSVAGMLAGMQQLSAQPGAQFIDYQGGKIAW